MIRILESAWEWIRMVRPEQLRMWMLLLFTALCAWQDIRSRSICIWTYLIFGAVGLFICFLDKTALMSVFAAVLPGVLLLGLSRMLPGSIGSGDGVYFLTAALYLDAERVVVLLFWSMSACAASALLVIVCQMTSGRPLHGKKTALPYLAFVFPVLCLMQL